MNAAEHIVEAYFRMVRGCFTYADKKVPDGNNRQLDLLACNVVEGVQFHIEIGVTHRENWCPTLEELGPHFEKKFFGAPPERAGANKGATDFEKGKSYFNQIERAYAEVGFDPKRVSRIWICWIVNGQANERPITTHFRSNHLKKKFPIQIVSIRDVVLRDLEQAIGTSNYDDEVLRTLGFIKQRESQMRRASQET